MGGDVRFSGAVKVMLIVNPTAGSGAGGRIGPEVQSALRAQGVEAVLEQTRGPGDGARLARTAREAGFDSIAVVGGDGSLNDVAQAYVDERGEALAGPAIALVPAGTGSDFQRTLGIASGVERAVE